MGQRLQEEIRQSKPFASAEEEAFLAIQRTASLLLQALAHCLKELDLSPAQYNLLRILKGAGSEALTCGEIGDRLVSPGPDVTRLLDRLEPRGLISRLRDAQDRRVVRARITEEGEALLARAEEPVGQTLAELLSHLGEERLRVLTGLLEDARLKA